MELDGIQPPELVKLHGELIAFGWIEQNTGHTPVLKAGCVSACYRILLAGLPVLREVEGQESENDAVAGPAEESTPSFFEEKT